MTPSIAFRVARRIFAVFGALVFSLIVAVFLITSWKTPMHQFSLLQLERNFRKEVSSHPTDSVSVLSFKKFGGLFSSAVNSCDYFVGEFRTSADSKENIREYYRNLSAQVRFGDEDDFWIYYPRSELYGKLLSRIGTFPSEHKGLYVVFISKNVSPPYADFRC